VWRDPRPQAALALALSERLEVEADAVDAGLVCRRREVLVVRPQRQDEIVSRRACARMRGR
jgi:hypothetical protein